MSKTETGWEGVPREGYAPGVAGRVVRNTIVGSRKESAASPGPLLEVRYFEVPAGASTRLEKHAHEHYVIAAEGVGHAIVGTHVQQLRPHDVVYVAPGEPHQFVNRGTETFGFFCIVAAHRDRAEALSPEELSALERSDAKNYVDCRVQPGP